ncbi:MAG: shikimate dehydrogenase [Phycisphaerae bacterium]|nr:shikimate dehydrogenase [Phycisphaerae bacterium]MDD5381410.1 shikimate dehydrogenase [Phycisphaerae bacterium]
MTYLAVPIAAKNQDQAKQQIKAAVAEDAEMLELRTDYLENISVDLVKNLIAEVKTASPPPPIIVTCRDKRQGGAIDYPVRLRIEILTEALKAHAEFIDFEYESFLSAENQERIRKALSQVSKGRLILSAHNFETKFPDIIKLHRNIQTLYPAAIPKLVYTARHINDCFDILDLLHGRKGDLIAFCMNEPGFITRILAKKLDGSLTFASIDEKTATAPGQSTIAQLKNLYRWESINVQTEFYGVIGSPIAHSLSPAIHNACFAKAGLNKVYLPLLVAGGQAEFNAFMDNILSRPWLGLSGLSVTIPHKENALNFVKENRGFVEPLADKIGAVNTIIISPDSKLSACNTDYSAAMDAIISTLGSKTNLKDLPAAVVGAGGVAKAIVAGLSNAGAKITVYNRTVERGKKLAAEFGCQSVPLEDLTNLDAKLVVNCTSVGMYPNIDETPIPREYLKKDMVVFDTIYNPAETLLLKQAKQAGAKTIDGLLMFTKQAAAQFKLFTGKDTDPKLMRKTISNCLSQK